MKNLLFAIFVLVSINSFAQTITPLSDLQSMSGETFTLNNPLLCNDLLGHWDNLGINHDKEKTKNNAYGQTWARTLRFETRFLENCDYDLGNTNQKDWNKLMQVDKTTGNIDETRNRLGWRYSIEKQKMELGFYGHINHTGNNSDSEVGREFFYMTDVDLNTWFYTELILGSGGMGVIIGNKGAYIKREDILPAGNVKTAFRKTAYFGGQECPPHKMKIKVSKSKGDKFTNWHAGACYKTFARSIFYNYENLIVTAANEIIMSEQVYRGQYDSGSSNSFNNTIPNGYASGDEIPLFESDGQRYVRVQSGSQLRCSAGEKIKLLPGFLADEGCYFSAKIDVSIVCAPFEKSTDQDNYSENEEVDTVISSSPIEVQEIEVSPNPSNAIFTVNLPEVFQNGHIQIYNELGEIVFTKESDILQNKIDLSHCKNGVYYLKIILNNQTQHNLNIKLVLIK